MAVVVTKKADTIRVFSRKAFVFRRWDEKDGNKVVAGETKVGPGEIKDMPSWITEDRMFGWARSDGSLEVLLGRADEQQAEIKASNPKTSNKVRTEKVTGA